MKRIFNIFLGSKLFNSFKSGLNFNFLTLGVKVGINIKGLFIGIIHKMVCLVYKRTISILMIAVFSLLFVYFIGFHL